MKWIKRIVFWSLFLGISLLLFIYLYAILTPLPLDEQRQSITLYDSKGNIVYESNFKKNMEWTPIEEIPVFIQDAVVSVEDKRFYHHIGFDPIRITKALISNTIHRDVLQGGSTITQQYAKNLFLTNDQTIKRKIEEFFYAARLEMHYTKDAILEGYLNTLYYGHGVYGIKKAAQFFFEKNLQDLSIAETAMLIGIPNGPSLYSPFLNEDQAKNRQQLILQILLNNETISPDEYQQAKNETLQYATKDHMQEDEKINPYYFDAVIQELQSLHSFSQNQPLKIYTSYDAEIQNIMDQSIKDNMNVKEELECAGIVTEPFTGNVLALAGGKDFTISQYNRAIHSQRQIASTIKPLLYYTALAQGFTPSTTFLSQPTTFQVENESYAPSNYDNKYPYREISMINAIAMSDNIYAVKTHLFLGTSTLHQALLDFGIEQSQENASEALGTVNMSILELSRIYNTFASEGLYKKPTFIQKVTDRDGKLLYEQDTENKRLLQRDLTLIVNQMMTSTYDANNRTFSYPTMSGYAPKTKTAIKSGTSDWDSWVVGFNPRYTVAYWTGYDDNRKLEKEHFNVAKRMYQQTFDALIPNGDGPWYQPSNAIEIRYVNPIDGTLDPQGSPYWYMKE